MVYVRHSEGGLSRPDMFGELRATKFVVPCFGTVYDVASVLTQQCGSLASAVCDVVVYHDLRAHCGEGKELLPLRQALLRYPDAFCSHFIPSMPGSGSVSLRHLRIGLRQFWLRYSSANDWRSNAGDVKVEVLCEERPFKELPFSEREIYKHPIVAVDFVRAGSKLFAIDLNVAPGLRGTGIESQVEPVGVYDMVELFFNDFRV